jgi:hypothetical protein
MTTLVRLNSVRVFAALAALSVTTSAGRADEPKPAAKENQLIGTWKLVSAKWGGTERKIEGLTIIKHVTPTQFMWARYDADGVVKHAMGGIYTLKGDEYVETTEYGTTSGDFTAMKGKAHKFKAKVDGNNWYHTGQLSGGFTIDEIWERVEKK